MVKEKISIICSVYNGEEYLLDTFNSCLNQVDVDVDFIVIDDFSTDNSREIIKRFESENENIKVIFNDTNLGFSKSVNKAATLCEGKYLLIIGHDDIIPRKHAANMINEFEKNTSFVHCNSVIIDSNNNEMGLSKIDNIQLEKNKNIIEELSFFNFISSTGLVMNFQDFLKVGGFPEKFKNYGEWYLWIKLASVGIVKYTGKSRPYYRRHSNNISKTFMEKDIKLKIRYYYQSCRRLAYSKLNLSNIQKIKYFFNINKKYLNGKINGINARIQKNKSV